MKLSILNRALHKLSPPFLTPVTVTLIISSLVTACQHVSQDSPASDVSEATPAETSRQGLKIGALLPATGELSPIGQPMLDALPLLVETVNGCGGVNDAPVTLIIEDSQTDPTAGAEAMTKLVEIDGVHGVVGAVANPVASAVVDIAVRNRVPMISPGGTTSEFTARAEAGEFEGYWIRTTPSDVEQARASAILAIDQGLTTVATVVMNDEYGITYERAFVRAFEDLGGVVVNADNPVRIDPNAMDFDSEADEAFRDNPDAVLGVLYTEPGALFLKSAFDQELMDDVQIILTDSVQTSLLLDEVGQTAEGEYILAGTMGTIPGAVGPALENFIALWEEKFGETPGLFVAHAWDALAMMILAAQAAGEHRGEAIKTQIRSVANAPGIEVTDICEALALLRTGEDINFQGASSTMDVDYHGNVIGGGYDIWLVDPEGKISMIDKVISDQPDNLSLDD
jgi:neutral amino acid transport system substrate-binding protein